MADYNFAQPVRSIDDNVTAGDLLVTQINGGTTPANKAEVNSDSEILTHDAGLEGDLAVVNGTTAFDVAVSSVTGDVAVVNGTTAFDVGTVDTVTTVTDVTTVGTISNDVAVVNGATPFIVDQTPGDTWAVTFNQTAGDAIHKYGTASAGVPNTPTDVVTHTVTTAKIFLLKSASFSASGKCRAELLVGGTAKAVGFVGTNGTFEWIFSTPIEVAAGVVVKISMTNKDNANQDLYAFLNGEELDI